MKIEDETTEKEKLLEEIAELKTRIKNTEYDLLHMFKGNSQLEQKLVISKKSLDEKQKILESIEAEKEKSKSNNLKKAEAEISEKENEPISSEQEKTIEDEFDKEIM